MAQLFKPPTIIVGDSFPPNPADPTWLFDSTTKQIFVYHEGKSKAVGAGAYTEVYACHRWVVLRGKNKIDVVTADGAVIFDNCYGVYCSADIFGFWGRYFAQFDDSRGREITTVYASDPTPVDLSEMQVQGQAAFCLPQFFAASVMFSWPDLRCWGILGGNGKWLIEPVYDHPFKFVDGVAEVVYKGEPRRINELGFRVE